jgi:uncharacterized protein YfdQ (DUF2303 family)
MANLTENEAAQRFAATSVKFDEGSTGQFAVIPDGFKIESLESFQDIPNRIVADHRFVTIYSLVEYVNRFGDKETMICANYEAGKILVTIDGDGERPSHKSHKARFEAQMHDVTKAWLSICGRPMAQAAFGQFLEDRAQDVIKPESASVMEMVMTFDATKKVTFKSAQRLHDGQRQLMYVEENEARGAVTFPDHFMILAPIYRGMEPQQIKFLVRYRIDDGKLLFSVDMHDKERALREAFDRCVDALESGLSIEAPVYITG